MQKLLFISICFIGFSSCGQSQPTQAAAERVNASECDDADAPIRCSFVDMPSNTNHIMRIPHNGNGTPMIIKGSVLKEDGSPYAGVAIYAYHTDEKGIYSKSGKETGAHKWHGQHHGWAVTNDKGQYEIHSIRPAKYPNSNGPAHIHAVVKTSAGKMYWISDFVFKDDPAVGANYTSRNPGGTGVVDIKLVNGRWEGMRDIKLSK